MTDSNAVCFVIAHKYVRGHKSYLHYYVTNIKEFYPEALIVVVDNNSLYKEDILPSVEHLRNVVVIDNNSDSKFELGAYRVALDYLSEKGLLENYSYFVFSQDTFILKNKYDFNELKNDRVGACPLVGHPNDWAKSNVWTRVLNDLGMQDKDTLKTELCWCNSFIVSVTRVMGLHSILKNIKVTTRHESEGSERYLGRILLELNSYKLYSIDGDIDSLSYYCHTVDPSQPTNHYFCKVSQQKNENTKDL